jgi:hypothetical protein
LTGPLGAVVANSILVGVCIGLFALDAYLMEMTLDGPGTPGRNDAEAVKKHMLITGTVFALGAILTVAFGLALAPLVVLATVAASVMAIDGRALHKIEEKRRHALHNEPTYQLVKEMLDADEVQEEEVDAIAVALKLQAQSLEELREQVNDHFDVLEEQRRGLVNQLQEFSKPILIV